jgi:hypothetical protein
MREAEIVGLTLAELSLVLLFAFLAITMASRSHLQERVDQLAKDDLVARRELSDARNRLQVLQKHDGILPEPKRLAARLRSSALPSCVEIGTEQDWLFTTVIRGRDAYEIEGHVLGLADVLARFDGEIASAKLAGCVPTIKVMLSATIGAADYDFALRQIEQHFYTKKLGIGP